jgi:membrane protein involved in D-alanine export
VIPYADFAYFGLLLYAVVPTLILGLFGRANWRWAFLLTVAVLIVQYSGVIQIAPQVSVREIWILIGFAIWQWLVIRAFGAAACRTGAIFAITLALSLLPLVLTKIVPVLAPPRQFGFIGISYITFRALDLVFCLRDRVIQLPGAFGFFGFLFFFPTISAGPIDRYRRFITDWQAKRTRQEFLSDLDGAVHRVFRGFLYKFILAVLIKRYWLDRVAEVPTVWAVINYMYAYSLYLFFDFAGYSAFAIAFSYLLGIHTPENFDQPFLARNIRDFWNRWHITLSFWFRDHVYMRFLLTSTRKHWFKNRDLAAITGYFLTFGLMGLWHGLEWRYIFYGLYQATLLSGFHLFAERTKRRGWPTDHWAWHAVAIFITFQFVCFGLLIFSGRLGSGQR